MTPSLIVDGLIVVCLLLALWNGWRQGALSAILSFVGVVAGLVIGMAVAPFAMELTDQVALRFLLAVGILVLLIGLGQMVGLSIGVKLRDQMRLRATQQIDSAFGSVLMTMATLVIVWLISIPVATGFSGPIGKGLRESAILNSVDRVMPSQISTVPARVAALLNESGLPPLVSPWEGGNSGVEVDAPNLTQGNRQLAQSLRPSVINVLGDATGCRRRLMGTGFVAQPNYVVTNAHVVAGTEEVRLDTVKGVQQATVVYYNPDVDIAVLYAPDLGLPALPWAEQPARTGDPSVVLGFPNSGPYTASPARIRDRITIAGPDIYAEGRVERNAYVVRGSIQQGNSGGPMVNEHGEVIGVVFGAAVDDSDTGYALTAQEVRSQTGELSRLTESADTGECVAR